MAIEAFSSLTMSLSDGNTIPSIDFLGSKAYADIGSGTVLKVSWGTPTATNNTVKSYIVHLLAYDANSSSYKILHDINVGDVNEFYLKSELLTSIAQAYYPLRIFVEAVSLYGTAYNCSSNTVTTYIVKGCGNYTKVEDGYVQPVMKRALVFAKLGYVAITDKEGRQLKTDDGQTIYAKAASVQDSASGWAVMQEFYSRDASNNWQTSDIKYEILTDSAGEIITDVNNSPVYTL